MAIDAQDRYREAPAARPTLPAHPSMNALPVAADAPPRLARHLPGLDGLRAIAILLVIPHNLNLFGTPTGWSEHLLGSLLDRGWIGVQLFFVLSGFLITGILLDSRGRSSYYISFCARRALRILPLYYASLLIIFVVLPLLGGLPASLPRNPGSEFSYWLLYSNWYGPFHEGQGSMPHLWSLAVEEQFYLLWPLLIHRRTPVGVVRMCLAIATASLGIRCAMLLGGAPTEAIYSFLVTRMDGLALGGAAAAALRTPGLATLLNQRRRACCWAGAILLFSGAATTRAFTFSSAVTLSWGYLALAGAFTLFIVSVACSDSGPRAAGLAKGLRSGPLQRIGRHSYAMYLLHVPLHVLVGQPLLAALGLSQDKSALLNLTYIALGVGASFAAAVAAYWAVEVHFNRLKTRLVPAVDRGVG